MITQEAVTMARYYFGGRAYVRHNRRRQEHLAALGLDLFDKSVLEVGAGVGDHTTFFLDRRCRVLSMEPRLENCFLFTEFMRGLAADGYPCAGRCQLIQGDIETLDSKVTQEFDIVHCYGLLYHLADPETALRTVAQRCRSLLLLETCVSRGNDEAINLVSEPVTDPTQAFHGTGCRPTRPWVFNRLREHFAHCYVPSLQPAHEEFPTDWTVPNPNAALSRAIFVASREPLIKPHLLDYVPDVQTRC